MMIIDQSFTNELMNTQSSSTITDSSKRPFSVSSTGTDSTVDTAESDKESSFLQNAGVRKVITKRKSFPFNSLAIMKLTTSYMDYTEKEIHDSFYSKAEYKKIQRDCAKQIMRMEQENTNKKGWCTRGLESHTRLGREQKRRVRDAAYQAVLDLQRMESYMAVSSISQRRAIAIAHNDHFAAV